MKRALFALCLAVLFGLPVSAQTLIDFERGFTPYFPYDQSQFDNVSLSTGGLVLHIPIVSYPQRGSVPPLSFFISYNNVVWQQYTYWDGSEWVTDWEPDGGDLFLQNSYAYVFDSEGAWYWVADPDGATHMIGMTGTYTAETIDGTALTNTASYVTDANGIKYNPGPPPTAADPYGNSVSSTTSSFTDTIGRTIPVFTDQFTMDTSGTAGCTTKDVPAPGSTSVPIEECYTHESISTNFEVSGVTEYSGTWNMLTSIILPNGQSWSFAYDNNGSLTSITTPSGGTISYTWYNPTDTGGWPYDSTLATRTVNDGSTSHEWQYYYSYTDYGYGEQISQTEVVDPDNDDAYHVFNEQGVETEARIYQNISGSQVLEKTVDTSYSGSGILPGGDNNPVLPVIVKTTLPNGGSANSVSQSCTVYDDMTNSPCASVAYSGPTWTWPGGGTGGPLSLGRSVARTESDWGSSSPGGVLRETATQYEWQTFGGGAYFSANLITQPASVIVSNGTYTAAKTTYEYDESSYAPSGCSSSAPCGALTTVNRYTGLSSYLTNHTYYSSYGMPTSSVDPATNATTYTYDSTHMFVNEIQYPSTGGTHIEYPSYDSNTGVLASDEDFNGKTTSYSYDSMRRITNISHPDGGNDAYCYSDEGGWCSVSGPPYIEWRSQATTSSTVSNSYMKVDGLGRTTQVAMGTYTTCSSGYSYVDKSYDNEGRLYSVSNPHCPSSGSTDGTTYYNYDAVNRTTSVTEQDGSSITTSYTGNCQTVTDEASKVRKSCMDGAGRMTGVWEDPSGANYETDYGYDPINDVTSVAQSSSRNRSFAYDFLGRLTSASNPESGTTYYSYYTSASSCSGDMSSVYQRTDARSITTTYCYDSLNRTTSRTYSDGTPPADFAYDQTSAWGNTLYNTNGRLSSEVADSGGSQAIFSYDPMGRTAFAGYCTPENCGVSGTPFYYYYDLAGDLTSYWDAAGNTITQSFAFVPGLVSQVTSTWSDSSHPGTLVSGVNIDPAAQVISATLGNNLTETSQYNPRLQNCRIEVNSSSATVSLCTGSAPSGNLQDLQVGYNYGSSPNNNGNVLSWSGSGAQTFTRNYYPYDSVNRLATMSSSSDPTGCYGLSWSYEAWGNRWQTATSGTCPQWNPASYNSSNQPYFTTPTFTYDYSGNIKYDGSHYYYYDAESRIIQIDGTLGTCSSATACYAYDPLGRRVEKVSGGTETDYLYDLSGHVIADMQSGSMTTGYVYWNDQLLAEYTDGTTYFVHEDHLGSTRLLTDISGCIVDNLDYFPFGELVSYSTLCTAADINNKFTGKERDSESNLDNSIARYYSSQEGRFMSPDPSQIFLADLSDPQQLNLYSYVRNNPLAFVDPTGTNCVQNPDGSYSNDGQGGETCDQANQENAAGGEQITVTGQPNSFDTLNSDMSDSLQSPNPLGNASGSGPNQPQTPTPLPNNGEPPSVCELANIAAVNSVSNLNVSVENVVGDPFPFNGGLNVNFSVPGASPSSLLPGRYPSSLLDKLIGIGSSLHVPGPGGHDPSTYGIDSTTGNFTFTTHIDTAYATWHTPIGAFIHYIVDVRDKGAHRTQCGGAG